MSAQRKLPADARFLTVEAAAELMSLSASGLRKLISRNLVPSVRFGRAVRVDVRKLEEQIEAQGQGTGDVVRGSSRGRGGRRRHR
jgi:excisionase family DNA binding protein